VVDDNEAVRSLMSRMLTGEGFQVTVACDGVDALAMLVHDGTGRAPVDLLLTDVEMPGLSGFELIDALTEKGIHVPTLVMSGNREDSLASQAATRGCLALLRKPFASNVLLGHIYDALKGTADNASPPK
jgi:two-component system response regulator FixJ